MISIIIPFHRNTGHLVRSLEAARSALDVAAHQGEIIVVADGAKEDCSSLAERAGARVLSIPGPSGPARARNCGALAARGQLLVFVDSDVVVARDAVARILAAFADGNVASIFGAYDEDPDDRGFHSQARNLAHSFVHQRSQREASTFWAGLGAVRRTAFEAVGGFDERFTRPCVEDIELGYRLRAAGFRIVLDHTIRGKHLKRWSLWSGLRSDVRDRGIPWTQLLHRHAAMRNDLNVSHAYRVCVIVSYLMIAFAAGAFWNPMLLVPVAVCAALLVWLDFSYYAFFVRQRGLLFTMRWFPVHVLHHLSNGVSFAWGTSLFLLGRAGVRAKGQVPTDLWNVGMRSCTGPAATADYASRATT